MKKEQTEEFDPQILNEFGTGNYKRPASKEIKELFTHSMSLYSKLLQAGVPAVCAQLVLPVGLINKSLLKSVETAANEVKATLFTQAKPVEAVTEKVQDVEVRKTYVRLNDNQKQALRKDSKKLSIDDLSVKYDVSTRTVRRVCKV